MSNIIKTQIEIAASPEEVRKIVSPLATFSHTRHTLTYTASQFFDFNYWPEIKSDLMRSVTRLPTSSGPIQKGERLAVNFKGITSQVVVLVRSFVR
jgi:hypothetical protein